MFSTEPLMFCNRHRENIVVVACASHSTFNVVNSQLEKIRNAKSSVVFLTSRLDVKRDYLDSQTKKKRLFFLLSAWDKLLFLKILHTAAGIRTLNFN